MDPLVFLRVTGQLSGDLPGSIVREVRQDGPDRFRLVFDRDGRFTSLVISLVPTAPWIGRPAGLWRKIPWVPSPFTAECSRALTGGVVKRFETSGTDRKAILVVQSGAGLALEISPHRANLVLIDASGRVAAIARRTRSALARLREGEPYEPAGLPEGKLVPHEAGSTRIDEVVDEARGEGVDLERALRTRLFGVGAAGARLVAEEAAASGNSAGEVLASRLGGIRDGRLSPAIEGPREPLTASREDAFDRSAYRLLPWAPEGADPGRIHRRDDPAATVGLFHEAVERAAETERRLSALRSVLARERRKAFGAEHKIERSLASFEDPERFRRWGEAILAGLDRTRRAGEHLIVPDPYDEAGGTLTVPAPPHLSPTAVAEECFRRHRRARRGLDAATRRLAIVKARAERLEAIHTRFAGCRPGEMGTLEEEMRGLGIAVGLEPDTRAGRARARAAAPRVEGVRIFTSVDGMTILVGKGGRQNDRLTFKLAGPDDFWMHVSGTPGAHVVVRNPKRVSRPPDATLEEAAALAAWFSDARDQGAVDVLWTRKKMVRKARGAPAGTVLVKRSETVRVRPLPPRDAENGGQAG